MVQGSDARASGQTWQGPLGGQQPAAVERAVNRYGSGSGTEQTLT